MPVISRPRADTSIETGAIPVGNYGCQRRRLPDAECLAVSLALPIAAKPEKLQQTHSGSAVR